MKNKRILVVSTSFPRKPGDPLSPFIWEFCRSLSEFGWKVIALVPHHPGLRDHEDWEGVSVRRFRYLPERFEDLGYSGGILPNIKQKPWRVFKLPFYICAMYRETLRIAEKEGIDVVNFHWLYPASFWLGRLARNSGVPVVMTGHGTDVHLASRGIFKYVANRAFRKASALTVNSDYMRTVMQRNELPSRVEVIPMGIDVYKFSPEGHKPSDSRTALYVGRLIKQKGIDVLFQAFIDVVREIPEARLEIIGYGPERDNIAKLLIAHRLEKSVNIIDMVPHDRLPEIYRRARVLLLPSLIPEGLGMTPAEAGLCGVPTITFGLGGTKEIVLDEVTGLIVKPGKETLASAMIRVFTDDALADILGANARKFLSEKMGWQSIAQQFNKLFTDIYDSARKSDLADEKRAI